MARRDKLWSFCAFSPSGDDRVRWHTETNYGHSAPCVNREERIRKYKDDVGRSVLIIFKFLQVPLARRLTSRMMFARTKLVSYLYFPFISNKRQVKRGNCHTLILSGDHLLVGMRPPSFPPINRGRRAEQKRSTLVVSENYLKLVRKIVSVKKI